MKKINLTPVVVLFVLSSMLSSCAAISGIFNAGMGFGILIVIVIIGVIAFIVMKAGKNKS